MRKLTFLMLFAIIVTFANAITPDALVLSNFGTKDVRPSAIGSSTLTYVNDPSDATNQVMQVSMPVNASSYAGGTFANVFYSKYITVGTTSATQYRYLVIRARKGTTNPFEIKLEFNLAAGAITANSKTIQINPIAGTYDYAANQNKWAYYIFDVGGNANANLTYKNLNISPDKGNISTVNTTYIDDIYFTNTPLITDFTTLSPQLAYSRTANEITITHTVPYARSYKIYDGSNTLLTTTTNALNTTIIGLTPNTSYTYKISGVNESGVESTKTTVTISTRKNKNATVEVIDDFEGASNIGWYNLSNAAVTYNESNPTTNGYNQSEKCAKVYIASGSNNYSGLAIASERITVGPNAPFRYLHFKLKRDADNGSIGVTFLSRWDINQDQKASQTITYAATMVDGNWYDYVFDLKDATAFSADGTYLGFYIRPNNTSASTNFNSNSYIDDIYLTNSQTASTDNITKKISTSSSSGGTATATATYITGDNVSLTATPSPGYHFVNWTESSSEVSTNATYSFTAASSRTLVANFELNTFQIISGTTNAADITCTTCDVTVASGAELTVGATKTLKSVSVAAGGKLTITAGTLNATNGITLESDATGTATLKGNGSLTGTVTAKQYLGSARNWYVSSPIVNPATPGFTTTPDFTGIDYYYEYMEGGNNTNTAGQPGSPTLYWKGVNKGSEMAVGKGYIAKSNINNTIQFSGTPNNGDITTTFDLTRDDNKGNGFNLVGNPYPSYIDWSLVAAANPNLDNTYYYRTKNTNITNTYTFVTWNGAGSGSYVVSNGSLPANTSITSHIPPIQAFWVRVKTGTSTTKMHFNNDMREHRLDNNNLMKVTKQNTRTSVRLQLQNGIDSDETLLYFDSGAANTFDVYDSPKMMNNSASIPDLYSKIKSERLVINGMNAFTENMEIPLGFSLNSASTMKFRVSELNNLPVDARVYLRDKQENIETELTPETEYAFSTTTATSNNESRFSMLFRVPGVTTSTTKTTNERISVFVNTQNQITIIAKPNSNYTIYNAMGQLIENGTLNSELQTTNCKLPTGIFVVKVNNQLTRVVIK